MNIDISVIIPCLNEQENLGRLLPFLKQAKNVETIVVDGGSDDYSCDIASIHADRLLASEQGRAEQMNKGAEIASGSILLFLHADTWLPARWKESILKAAAADDVAAGAFDLQLQGDRSIFRLIGKLASIRSRLTKTPYGDQAIFIRKKVFEATGGYPRIPIMEEVELIRRVRSQGRIVFVNPPVITSSRKWIQYGIIRTTGAHWLVALAFILRVPPSRLKSLYHLLIPKQ